VLAGVATPDDGVTEVSATILLPNLEKELKESTMMKLRSYAGGGVVFCGHDSWVSVKVFGAMVSGPVDNQLSMPLP
jgi:hypothetical protein